MKYINVASPALALLCAAGPAAAFVSVAPPSRGVATAASPNSNMITMSVQERPSSRGNFLSGAAAALAAAGGLGVAAGGFGSAAVADQLGDLDGGAPVSMGAAAIKVTDGEPLSDEAARIQRKLATQAKLNGKTSSDDPLLHAREAADEHTTAVYKLVLTGGPCAGKTTALSRMGEFFRGKGFRVFTVPEAATSMFSNGIDFQDLGSQENRFAFQWGILSLQMTLEDGFERFARACGQPSILLCDRGLMDGSVYMPPEEWACLVRANGLDERSLRDGRYDGILHLVTAACGAEQHYSLENNEVRSESVEEAKDVDAKTEAVWLGHPRHLVFDNSTDFEAKLSRLTTAASRLVGLPCRPRKLCKFLLYEPPPPLEEFPVPAKQFHAEKVYLLRREAAETGEGGLMTAPPVGDDSGEEGGPGEAPAAAAACVSSESFLEKRGRDETFVHSLTTLSSYSDGTVAEVTKQLSAAQHESIERERADTARPKVVQRRVSFLWERQAFELHTDMEPAYGINVLHRRSEGGELSLPTFLKVDE